MRKIDSDKHYRTFQEKCEVCRAKISDVVSQILYYGMMVNDWFLRPVWSAIMRLVQLCAKGNGGGQPVEEKVSVEVTIEE